MPEPNGRGFPPIAPIVQLVRTGLDRAGQNAEMWLHGFIFGFLDEGQNATRFETRSGAFDQNGSWSGSWRLPIDLSATDFLARCRRSL